MTMNASVVPAVTSAEVSSSTNLIVIQGNGNGQPPAPPRLPSKQPEIVQMPVSSATHLMDDVLMAGTFEQIKLMCSRRKKNLRCDITLQQGDNTLKVINKKNGNTTVLRITDMQAMQSGHEPARKLFGFLRMKLNQGVIHDGELLQEELTFPLNDLVDVGMYSSVTSARRAFNAAAPVLTAVQLRIELNHKSGSRQDELQTMLLSAFIDKGVCHIKPNPDFDWKSFFVFFAPTPAWVFSLPLRPQALALYIHELARQHVSAAENSEEIKVKFETLRCKLCLPENKNGNGCRDVLGGLMQTIEAIETRQSEFLHKADLQARDRAEERWFGEVPGICFGFGTSEEPKTMKEFANARLSFTVGGPVRTELVQFCLRKKEKAEKSRLKAEKQQNAVNNLIAKRIVDKMDREGQLDSAADSQVSGNRPKQTKRMKA